jgi:hypothetical protein
MSARNKTRAIENDLLWVIAMQAEITISGSRVLLTRISILPSWR